MYTLRLSKWLERDFFFLSSALREVPLFFCSFLFYFLFFPGTFTFYFCSIFFLFTISLSLFVDTVSMASVVSSGPAIGAVEGRQGKQSAGPIKVSVRFFIFSLDASNYSLFLGFEHSLSPGVQLISLFADGRCEHAPRAHEKIRGIRRRRSVIYCPRAVTKLADDCTFHALEDNGSVDKTCLSDSLLRRILMLDIIEITCHCRLLCHCTCQCLFDTF